jgi:hypothetical protein
VSAACYAAAVVVSPLGEQAVVIAIIFLQIWKAGNHEKHAGFLVSKFVASRDDFLGLHCGSHFLFDLLDSNNQP